MPKEVGMGGIVESVNVIRENLVYLTVIPTTDNDQIVKKNSITIIVQGSQAVYAREASAGQKILIRTKDSAPTGPTTPDKAKPRTKIITFT